MSPADLADHTWPELAAIRPLLALPVGSTEQHGPHLPLSVDTDVALHLARSLAAARPGVMVAPPLAYGSSGEHAGFPGTLSIGRDVTESVVVELVRSADHFAGVVVVCGHGGNAEPLARAASLLGREGRRVMVWAPSATVLDRVGAVADGHAGRWETSVMLALRPELVRAGAAEPGERRPVRDILPALHSGGVAAVSANGVLGDPTGASPDEGRRLLELLTDDLVERVDQWR